MKIKGMYIIPFLELAITLCFIVNATIDPNCNYDNYLNSLEIVSYDSPLEAGRSNSIIVKVNTNTEVKVHAEIKGSYSWGEWVFSHSEELIQTGTSEIALDVDAPFKTIIEPTCHFYYYVYVTFPDDPWSPTVWGIVQNVTVTLPLEIYLEDVLALLGHIKWTIHKSSRSERIKIELLTKLDEITNMVVIAFESGNTQKIVQFLEYLLDIRYRHCEAFDISDISFHIIE